MNLFLSNFHNPPLLLLTNSSEGIGSELSIGHLILAIMCLALSGFLSGMEAGVLSLNRERLRVYIKQGRKSARILNEYLSQPAHFLWTILAGNILFSFAALFSLVLALINPAKQNPWWFAIGFLIFVIIYVTLFDLLPKSLYQRFPARLCMHSVGIFRFITLVLKPLVWIVSGFGNLFLKPSKDSTFFDHFYESRDQIKTVLKDSSQIFTQEEGDLIAKVMDRGDKPVSKWMRPIESAIKVNPDDSVYSFVEKCKETKLNRLPVIERAADRYTAIGEIGLYSLLFDGKELSSEKVSEYMLAPICLSSSASVHEALSAMQVKGRRMAIIIGRDNEALGLVTLNDVLGIIFGEVDI